VLQKHQNAIKSRIGDFILKHQPCINGQPIICQIIIFNPNKELVFLVRKLRQYKAINYKNIVVSNAIDFIFNINTGLYQSKNNSVSAGISIYLLLQQTSNYLHQTIGVNKCQQEK